MQNSPVISLTVNRARLATVNRMLINTSIFFKYSPVVVSTAKGAVDAGLTTVRLTVSSRLASLYIIVKMTEFTGSVVNTSNTAGKLSIIGTSPGENYYINVFLFVMN